MGIDMTEVPRRHVRGVRGLAALGAALLLSACGSTVSDLATGQPTNSTLDGALSLDSSPLSHPAPFASESTSLTPSPDTEVPSSSVVPSSSSAISTPTTATSRPIGQATSPVEVGFEYLSGVGDFASALGISADVGDGRAQTNAVVAYVNSQGGLAGHPIRPVFWELKLTRTDPYAQFMQEMCTTWTQDHHVVAAFSMANADYTPLASCLGKKRALFTSYEAYARAQSDWKVSPYWIEPATLTAERLARLEVADFAARGFFKGQKRVGLLAYDYPQAKKLTAELEAQLKTIGVTATVYSVKYGTSTGELAGTIASIQSASLRFRSEGIQRVMNAAYPGAIAYFMRNAQSQGYQPLYGLTSYDELASLSSNAPVKQMHGAIAVGWKTTSDYKAGHIPSLNANGKLCRTIFSKAGIPLTQDPFSFAYCDFVLSLKAASRGVTGTLDGAAIAQGLERLGDSYSSPSTLGTTLSPSRHDGVSSALSFSFDDGCSCWKSSGSPQVIPY